MRNFLRRLRARIKYRHFERDIAQELKQHRDMAERDARRDGLNDRDARWHAARTLGNATLAREAARGVWLAPWLESVWQDLRHAVHALRHSPGFTLTAGTTLVVVIGLNASVFSVVNAILLKPWPVADPSRVVVVFATQDGRAGGMSPAEYRFLRDRTTSVHLTAIGSRSVHFVDDAGSEGEQARVVGGNYFDVLGIPLQLGRGFVADDDRPGTGRAVAVLSDQAWQRRFGADPDVVGRQIHLDAATFTVIGVAMPGANDSQLEGAPPAVWLPLTAVALLNPDDVFSQNFLTEPGHCCVRVAGRLTPGAKRTTAQTELSVGHAAFQRDEVHVPPERLSRIGIMVTDTRLLSQPDGRRVAPLFTLIFAGTLLLLVLASANIGTLQLARAMSRHREVRIRMSLGAGRARIVRQFLTEGLVLALASGTLSVGIACLLPPFVLAQVPGGRNATGLPLGANASVLLFTLGVSLCACVLFGLAPALRGTQRQAFVRGNRQSAPGRIPLRTALLSIQVGISTVLLVAAALLVRGVFHAATFDPGFRYADVLLTAIQLPKDAYTPEAQAVWLGTYRHALADAEIGPVGATGIPPLSRSSISASVRLPGGSEAAVRTVEFHSVSPGYFDVLDIPFVAGRNLQPSDRTDGVIVNETLAHTLWGNTPALGRPLVIQNSTRTVVGVVKDAYLTALDQRIPTCFVLGDGTMPQFLVRDAPGRREQLEAIVRRLDPRATLTTRSLSANVREWLRTSLVGAAIAAALGICGLVLATIGVFGVFAYLVNERTREIGIRLAIGARSVDIVGVVMGTTARALGIGLSAGLVAALLAGPVLRNNLFGVSPRDPGALLVSMIAIAMAAIAATLIPVRRALRVDPAVTLKAE